MKYDFDEWKALAEKDPEAFEQQRQQAIEHMITSVPQERQQRLRGLQWRVDVERAKYKNALMGCRQAFNMMWDSVYSEHGLQRALNFDLPQHRAVQAEVLAFKPRASTQDKVTTDKVTEK